MKKLKKVYRQTTKRWKWALYKKRSILSKDIEDFLKDGVRLHIGCGDKKLEGYLNIDIVPTQATDVVMDIAKGLDRIPSDIAAEIRLESVFEHFYRYDQMQILRQFHRILKKGGSLLIYWLPDFDTMIEAYLKKENVGIKGEEFDLYNVYRYTHGDPIPKNSPQQLHKDIFTKDSIKSLLEEADFSIEKLKNEKFPGEHLAVGINIKAVKG
ncbi:MAG: hypothetical protein JW869_06335 [Candidatus Omnitrophica bacterium]|nr:hypothetical protein [Candidatus Omnitrophota bacterium]